MDRSLPPYLNFLGAFGSTVSGSEFELLLSHSLHCLNIIDKCVFIRTYFLNIKKIVCYHPNNLVFLGILVNGGFKQPK